MFLAYATNLMPQHCALETYISKITSIHVTVKCCAAFRERTLNHGPIGHLPRIDKLQLLEC